MMLKLLPVAAAVLAVSAAAETPLMTTVRTTGSATVAAQPDAARFQASVMSFGDEAEAAAAENARRMEALLDALDLVFPLRIFPIDLVVGQIAFVAIVGAVLIGHMLIFHNQTTRQEE